MIHPPLIFAVIIERIARPATTGKSVHGQSPTKGAKSEYSGPFQTCPRNRVRSRVALYLPLIMLLGCAVLHMTAVAYILDFACAGGGETIHVTWLH